MFFAYLSLGIVLAALIHYGLKFFAQAEPTTVRRVIRFMLIAVVIGIIVLLMRAGLIHLAAIISFVGVALPLITRALHAKAAWNSAQRSKQSESDQGNATQQTAQRMTKAEAQEVLGVDENASRTDIQEAYHRLIRKNHPDQGGSKFLASQINTARDILLNDKEDT